MTSIYLRGRDNIIYEITKYEDTFFKLTVSNLSTGITVYKDIYSCNSANLDKNFDIDFYEDG